MITLSSQLDNYLRIRRGLGFALRTEERMLRRFIGFVSSEGSELLERDHFARWMKNFGSAGQHTCTVVLGS